MPGSFAALSSGTENGTTRKLVQKASWVGGCKRSVVGIFKVDVFFFWKEHFAEPSFSRLPWPIESHDRVKGCRLLYVSPLQAGDVCFHI